MYAITATSYRSIARADDAHAGETVVDAVPQSLIDSLANAESANTAVSSDLRTEAGNALANLRAYRDLTTPSNAQTIAVVKLLCRVAITLTRLQLAKLDAVD